MLEDCASVIRAHAVPGSEFHWRSREPGYFGRFRASEVTVGELDDGRWYMRRLPHPVSGPWQAGVYASEAEATAAAREFMAEAEPKLVEAGYRPYVEMWTTRRRKRP